MSDRLAQVRSVYEAINRGDYAVIGAPTSRRSVYPTLEAALDAASGSARG